MSISTVHIIMLFITTVYLIFQYIFAIKILAFLNRTKKYCKADKMMLFGIGSLIFGDTIHLIYLYINYIKNDIWLNGFGMIALAITSVFMTVYYLGLLFFIVHEYQNGKVTRNHYIILIFFIIRIILAVLPQNNYAIESEIPTLVRTFSNVSFCIFGFLTLLLFNQEIRKRMLKGDSILKGVVIAGIISFTCYVGHLILYPINPIFGMLMLPKSIAYNFELFYLMKGIMLLRTSSQNAMI